MGVSSMSGNMGLPCPLWITLCYSQYNGVPHMVRNIHFITGVRGIQVVCFPKTKPTETLKCERMQIKLLVSVCLETSNNMVCWIYRTCKCKVKSQLPLINRRVRDMYIQLLIILLSRRFSHFHVTINQLITACII